MSDKAERISHDEPGTNGYRPSNTQTLHDNNDALTRVRTAGALSFTPEQFEKLYLSPKNAVSGDLRKTFANPTPIGLAGFVMALTPLSMDFMGWRGVTGGGAATVGAFYFLGGVCLFIGGILEWVLGNTFPCVVFISFAGFWTTYGAILTPSFGSAAAYSASGTDAAEGAASAAYNITLGFYLLWWAVMVLVYLVCSLRTNIAFVLTFFWLELTLGLLTGTYLQIGNGNAGTAGKCLKAAGACAFLCSLTAWYILVAVLLGSLEFPFSLPVGDLSNFLKKKDKKVANNV